MPGRPGRAGLGQVGDRRRSFGGEVCGRLKQGAGYGYTHLLGYHPILATRADTREALHIRLRKGSANLADSATPLAGSRARVGRCSSASFF